MFLLEEELDELKSKNLFRQLRTLESREGVYAFYQGKRLLLFCANDYLGLSQHPKVISAAQKAAGNYGIGAGAARLISGTQLPHHSLEVRLAALKKKERALIFPAGYLANLGVLGALAGEKDLIVLDKLSHASLIDGAKVSGAEVRVFPHKNYGRCREILKQSAGHRRKILVSDSIFSMDGDLADLKELAAIKKESDCLLIVDDAHATGVLGTNGGGAAEDSGLESEIDVFTGTLSKAFGCVGGFAAASESIIQYLINRSRSFIFATALPPFLCSAVERGIDLLGEEPGIRQNLWKNIQRVHAFLSSVPSLTGRGKGEGALIDYPIQSPIFPIIIGEEKEALRISEELFKQGILIPAIRYPAVAKGKARLRLTVSAVHSEEHLKRLFAALKKVMIADC